MDLSDRLQALEDLDSSLRQRGSRLVVLRGDPLRVLPSACKLWHIEHLYYEIDIEPYGMKRDAEIQRILGGMNVDVYEFHGHTLFDAHAIVNANKGRTPLTFDSFATAAEKIGRPEPDLTAPDELPAVIESFGGAAEWVEALQCTHSAKQATEEPSVSRSNFDWLKMRRFFERVGVDDGFSVPDVTDLGFIVHPDTPLSPHIGGESVALQLLNSFWLDPQRVALFEKPETSPAAFSPYSTTVLSPHLKHGSLSPRLMYRRLVEVYQRIRNHSLPPVSLLGQLYWREFYYCVATVTPNYSTMKGNPVCLQVDWWCQDGIDDDRNPKAAAHLQAWTHGRTGYSWIDAIMTQLRNEGWIHHLARHSVACFLTRGDLFISWERGAEVFEELLLDYDWALNVGNWLWLSASAFFHRYFRVYSPTAFPKKWDSLPYIRKFVPALSDYPEKYILEPWKAPLADQKKARCIIGKDYPKPIVVHENVVKDNMAMMKSAYESRRESRATDGIPAAKPNTLAKKRTLDSWLDVSNKAKKGRI